MRKTLIAALAALVVGGAAYAAAPICSGECMVHREPVVSFEDRYDLAPPLLWQAQDKTTTTVPVVVKGGDWAASILEWFQVAFIGTLGTLFSALVYRGLSWMGVQVTDQQKAQLQGVIVNGLNSAAAKAAVDLRSNTALDINVKSQIVADAVKYAQDHAADTIKALGLDPNSGQAVEAIRARIETALNDPTTPTPPAITPVTGGGLVNQPLAPSA